MGESGCVSWMFKEKGVLTIDKEETDLSLDDLKAAMDPSRYVGRAPKQVEEFLEEVIRPVLADNAGELGMTAEINV